jgi:hypothetical protein
MIVVAGLLALLALPFVMLLMLCVLLYCYAVGGIGLVLMALMVAGLSVMLSQDQPRRE